MDSDSSIRWGGAKRVRGFRSLDMFIYKYVEIVIEIIILLIAVAQWIVTQV